MNVPYPPPVRIRLDHVSHSYAASEESAPVQVLDDVTLEIPLNGPHHLDSLAAEIHRTYFFK